ncbi:hypothetical protein DEO72_LG3g1449 [Vigna unguiculata]|uniref:Uncharacterized protein n=1 Tax=Vigna unguiculata TaxID=3917 RepID=A0A4D6LEL0_VIGUN|nr:hypothetical protein DEO72_LG3g1449 [Vigna unguiculata]
MAAASMRVVTSDVCFATWWFVGAAWFRNADNLWFGFCKSHFVLHLLILVVHTVPGDFGCVFTVVANMVAADFDGGVTMTEGTGGTMLLYGFGSRDPRQKNESMASPLRDCHVSGKSLSPLGFGGREWFRRDYGGGRRRRECDVVAAMEAMPRELVVASMENPWWFPWLRWRRENDGTELALATAGLASVATMVVAGDVNERARCSDARKHGGARVWCSDGGAMVARCRPESCRRWRCDGGTRKKTQRLESRRRGSGRFEMLERNGGGVPARARRGGCSLAGRRKTALDATSLHQPRRVFYKASGSALEVRLLEFLELWLGTYPLSCGSGWGLSTWYSLSCGSE